MFGFLPQRQSLVLRRAFIAICSIATLLVVSITSGTALAQWEADRATARNLAAEGNAALNIGDFATAEDRFRRADALVHAPTLVVDHAKALIGLHRYVEAQERLELVIREGVADNAPWVWKKALQEAKQLVEEVKPKIAWVTISVTGASNPEVWVDGVQVPVAALGVRRATDPGPHRIKATAPGFLKKEIILPVSEGSERAVTLELQRDPALLQPSTHATVQTTPPVPPPIAPERKHERSFFNATNIGYATLAVGGAGLIVGTVTGIMFLKKESELQDKCPNKDCQGRVPQSVIDQRNRYGIISPIGIGVGLAGSLVGVLLLVSDKGEPTRHASATSVFPYFGVDRIGVEGTF